MVFWIIVGAFALTVALFLARAFLAKRTQVEHPAAYDLKVYKDQLSEVDRDVARGIVSEDEGARLKVELSRKILAADAQIQEAGESSDTVGRGQIVGALLVVVVIVAGGFGLYKQLGAPGYSDMGLKSRKAAADEQRKSRPTQEEFEASLPVMPEDPTIPQDFLDLLTKLRAAVEKNPDDLEGLMLLGRNETAIGNYAGAYKVQAQIIKVKGDDVTAGDYVNLADLLVMAANGYVSPEAEEALVRAMQINENHPVARYYTGLLWAQNGRADLTFRIWRKLLDEGPSDAPWIAPIRAQILNAAQLAGVDYTLPPLPGFEGSGFAGPSAEDIAAAQDLSAEEQAEMIKGMVNRLSQRLAEQGGSPQEWGRLISSLGFLGEIERATAIWQEATQVFGADPEALAIVRAGAVEAGVAE